MPWGTGMKPGFHKQHPPPQKKDLSHRGNDRATITNYRWVSFRFYWSGSVYKLKPVQFYMTQLKWHLLGAGRES